MKKSIIIATLFCICCLQSFSQQLPMYSQYIFNNTVINPAQAGASGVNHAGLSGRYQWLGIEGAPMTHSAFVNMSLPLNMGVSAGIFQDNLGPVKNFNLHTDVSYKVQIAEEWFMSAGLRLFFSSLHVDFTNLENVEAHDPLFTNDISTGLHLNMGAGLLAFSDQFYVGLSLPQATQSAILSTDKQHNTFSRHLFVYGGGLFMINEGLSLAPSILFKNSDNALSQLDINAVVCNSDFLDIGLVARSNFSKGWLDAIGLLVGMYITENWYFGYIYEYPTNGLHVITKQSHEISLRYQWGNDFANNFVWPRFFH